MRRYDVQHVELETRPDLALAYLADSARLPEWTRAFASVSGSRARLRTPRGEVEVELETRASRTLGTVDWHMRFPDGSLASAFSRLVEIAPGRCAYTFVLTAPPVPLEQLEGALDEQSRTLSAELAALKARLEARAGA